MKSSVYSDTLCPHLPPFYQSEGYYQEQGCEIIPCVLSHSQPTRSVCCPQLPPVKVQPPHRHKPMKSSSMATYCSSNQTLLPSHCETKQGLALSMPLDARRYACKKYLPQKGGALQTPPKRGGADGSHHIKVKLNLSHFIQLSSVYYSTTSSPPTWNLSQKTNC